MDGEKRIGLKLKQTDVSIETEPVFFQGGKFR